MPSTSPRLVIRLVSSNTSRANRCGFSPSAIITPNSRVRSSTDISCVLSTLNATSTISTTYMNQALAISAWIAWRRPGCNSSQSRSTLSSGLPGSAWIACCSAATSSMRGARSTMLWPWLPMAKASWK